MTSLTVQYQPFRFTRTLFTITCLIACSAVFLLASASAHAGTTYVDGISDQNLPYWDSGFNNNSFFRHTLEQTWVSSGHLTWSRHFVPWDVMGNSSVRATYYPELAAWYSDASALKLTLLVSFAWWKGIPAPESNTEYRNEVTTLLKEFPGIHYVEAWNEPNEVEPKPGVIHDSKESAVDAAHFTNQTHEVCISFGCTVIAGDFSDYPPELAKYEKWYVEGLNWSPTQWGFHPYKTTLEKPVLKEGTTVWTFQQNLPNKGSDDDIWFTEVGAYQCTAKGGARGVAEQAVDAGYLVQQLMPWFQPLHVFYYYFDYKARLQPPCGEGNADTAIYYPTGNSEVPDGPRPAASLIFDNKYSPWAYTTNSANVREYQAGLRGAAFTGGFFNTVYYFQYGPTTSYGHTTQSVNIGSAAGLDPAATTIRGLTPGVTYHYRLVTHNTEGTSYGTDHTVTATSPGDFSGDGHADVMVVTSEGMLQLYEGDGSGGWLNGGKPVQVGTNWGGLTSVFGVGDFNGDGYTDAMAVTGEGTLLLFESNGSGGWLNGGNGINVGHGFGVFSRLFGVGDFNGDGYTDVMGVTGEGNLLLYEGDGSGGWLNGGNGINVGYGFGVYTKLCGVDDFSGNGYSDLIGVTSEGNVILYEGNGSGGWLNGGSGIQIASEWGSFPAVIAWA